MGRNKTRIRSMGGSGREWERPYRVPWGIVVGDRVRRLRTQRGMRLWELSEQFYKPGGGHYSVGYFSRLEQGFASPPLWVYTLIAEAFDLAPGRLLGTEGFEAPVSEGELTLVRLVRRLDIEPDEAIARIVAAGAEGR